MKRKGKSVTQVLWVMCICSMLIYIPVSATQSKLDNVRDNIEQLEEEQVETQEELEGLEADKVYLDGRASELDARLSEVAAELSQLQEQLTAKKADIQENQQRLEEARQEEEQQYEDMKKRIRFMYERGDGDFLGSLLGAESFADYLNLSEYVESIHLYDRKMLKQYQTVKEEIAARETKLEEEKQELENLAQQQEDARREVGNLLSEVKANISATNGQIADAKKQIEENERQLAQQKAYEEELEAQKVAEDAARLEEIKKQEAENTTPPVIIDSESDLTMLAALIECEAGGESYEGKLAVGSVVMNRVRSSYFPNSVVEVIYQSGQFTPVTSGRFATVLARGAAESCVQAASECLAGKLTVSSLYFRRNKGTIEGIIIGNHVFY